jgi:diguanylate cyclase (GGDEF)-like protein
MEKKVELAIFRELVEVLYRNLSLGLLGVILQALILLWFLFGYVGTPYLLTWFLIVALNSLGGYLVIKWYRHTQNDARLLMYHYYGYIVGSSITAIMLGVIGSILMPSDMAHQTLVMLAIISITGASVQNLHASYLASGYFLGFSLLPLLIWQFIQILNGQPVFIGIFIITLCYCLYLIIDVRTGFVTLSNNIRLKFENIQLSIHDELTGLYNRHYLKETLHKIIAKVKRNHTNLSFILFDIDFFKKINDIFGHDAGDVVLKKIGDMTKKFFRESDFVFRYGGEEFLIILEGVSPQQAMQRMDNYRELINDTSIQLTPQSHYTISISAGIAVYPVHGDSADILIRAADKALYKAKNNGRNLVCLV